MRSFSIAFDLDGTLIDISVRDYQIYHHILSDNGYKPVEFDSYWKLRQNKTNIFEILRLSTDNENFHASFIEQRNLLIENPNFLIYDTIFDDTYSVLRKLSNIYSLYLVSLRNSKKNALDQINKFQLCDFFEEIYITNEEKYKTYSSISSLKAIIGDTENDILAAQRLNICNIGVTTGIRNKAQLELLNSQYIVSNLKDILNILL